MILQNAQPPARKAAYACRMPVTDAMRPKTNVKHDVHLVNYAHSNGRQESVAATIIRKDIKKATGAGNNQLDAALKSIALRWNGKSTH